MPNILPRSLASSTKDALTLASEAGVVKQRWSLGQGMQDVDCVPHVQAFPEPVRRRRPRSETKALRVVTRSERLDGVTGHRNGCRHLRQRAAVGPPELERPVGPPRDLEALFVHRAMMPGTQHREVGQRRRAPVRPVAEMMPLAMAHAAAREAATQVPSMERSP
jgi:hypothetical protein